ncbi:MAG TPA: ABC transporter permease, partial [Cyclobacteriaceae bacterium]|nr:ABC transporter permease [Cyclobacteriaceae bacterium]
MLNSEQVDFIIKDLNFRGIVAEEIQDEIIDHICSSVEDEINSGLRFIDAYDSVLQRFGHNAGLRETQKQIIETENFKAPLMLRNYFTIAFRNLKKHRFYTFINILGLATGIAACLVIVLYVTSELNYDRYHRDADRIYRVNCEIKFGANHLNLAVAPAPLADALRTDYPEVEHAARFWNGGSVLIKRTDQNIKETEVVYADSSIFSVFTIPFLQGNPKQALRDPFTMVISKNAADKYFPNENPIGQTLIVENKDNYKITGVYENIPSASHFHFDIMLALVSTDYNKDQNWLSNNFTTFIKLRQGTNYKNLEAKLPKMIDTYAGPQARLALGNDFTMEKFRASGNKLAWTLMPLTDIHLHSDLTAELGVNSDIIYVYLFSAVALFILGIAGINFMNLSTARSANRAKEVGVRKVMGSLRSHLVRQFLTESILLSLLSLFIGLLVAWMALPLFNELSNKQLSLPLGNNLFWAIATGSTLVIGVLAGIYPSLFLSAFKPVNVLKGNLALGMKSGSVRSALVVFQFSISIILIIGTIAVNYQLNYIQNKKIGFNKAQVIIIKDTYGLGKQVQSFKDEVLKDSRIISGTISGFLPVSGTNRNDNTHWPFGSQPTQDNMVSLQCWRVDYDYVKTLGMKIKIGRDFSKEFPSDSNAVILNEAAIQLFGYKNDPLGKKISTFKNNITPGATNDFSIVGVVEDFHFESLKQTITPLAFFLSKSTGLISFRFEAKDTKEVISSIEKTWKAIAPDMPFSYSFLDQDFGRMYSSEQRLGKIFVVFAGLAIIIACLGLFALTAFTSEQRTKEIGIRKVLGASVSSIIVLLSREFGKLILIAFVIAVPIAWYGIDWWLKSYSYKVEVGAIVYLLAGVGAFAIALFTMGYQSMKA